MGSPLSRGSDSGLLRERLYSVLTGPWFPGVRLLAWCLLVPAVMIWAWLKESVTFLVIISIAAGIESALTDVIDGAKHVVEE